MAIVKIEMSEYKAMEEKAEMLKSSLEKETALHEEIKNLQKENAEQLQKVNEEKIKTLEEAEKKVVKVVKNISHQEVYLKRYASDFAITRFLNSLGLNGRQVDQIIEISRNTLRPTSIINNYSWLDNLNPHFVTLREALFETEVIEKETDKTVTLHGLDELRDEIKAELKEEMDEDIKFKMDHYEKLKSSNNETLLSKINASNENYKLKQELEESRRMYDSLNEKRKQEIDELADENRKLFEKFEEYKEFNERKIKNLKQFNLNERTKIEKFEGFKDILKSTKNLFAKLKFYWTMKNHTTIDKKWFD